MIEVDKIKGNYDHIIFQQSYSQPYIYFLFFTKYDPTIYQKNAKIDIKGSDVGLVQKLDNINFLEYSWPPPIGSGKTLVIGDEVVIPPFYSKKDFNLVSEIKYPDGVTTAFRILGTK